MRLRKTVNFDCENKRKDKNNAKNYFRVFRTIRIFFACFKVKNVSFRHCRHIQLCILC